MEDPEQVPSNSSAEVSFKTADYWVLRTTLFVPNWAVCTIAQNVHLTVDLCSLFDFSPTVKDVFARACMYLHASSFLLHVLRKAMEQLPKCEHTYQ
jgi:hypothetical protein